MRTALVKTVHGEAAAGLPPGSLGERAVEGTAHFFLGLHHMFVGASDKARGHLSTALAIQQEAGDRVGEARSTTALGLTLLIDDEPVPARELSKLRSRSAGWPRTGGVRARRTSISAS